ncbi:IclR family transcriptional regulator domain-containing protein [Streptomyces sp. NBC_00151]|uniref:IclR family transcriptional regulator domain-containing protein n=1 Tax=Streptomyces sp. NBC_00151 TaxID=2975669 RepID=UPI002DDB9C34|nr:IclR family transcriptional regulator C-terminal domain-containing protein [Streptomyces sp. NBC_00151]WRZ41202.1 helix-turn-helix domain-containing protein [Streptomyces sp. NBC_00151]
MPSSPRSSSSRPSGPRPSSPTSSSPVTPANRASAGTGNGSAVSGSGAAGAEVPDEAVTPLIRGLAVLRRLTEADGSASLSGLERATGLARSTVDRITATLARMGYLRLDGRDAVLAPRLMELGNAYLAALRLPRVLDAYADALADELDESVSIAVCDRDGIRFIHQATRRRAMSLRFRIGDLLPAERTAPGPLFASEWSEEEWTRWRERRAADPEDRGFPAVPARSRPYEGRADISALPASQRPTLGDDFEQRTAEADETGWALDDQLIEPGLVALSMPVREAGRIACVVNVVSHTSRHSATELRDALLPRLRTAVAEMERALARDDEPTPERKSELAQSDPPTGTGDAVGASGTIDAGSPGTAGIPGSAGSPGSARSTEPSGSTKPSGKAATPSGLADWTGASKQELGREFIESLARGLTVITAFGEGRGELTLTAVAQATGLSRATARRALITLEHLGYVTTHDRVFRLTPRVLGLGFPPLSRTTLPEIAAPHLTELSQRLHDSVSLAVLTGDEIQYIGHVSTRGIMSVHVTVGTRLPAYATSLGRAILADLPKTRATEMPAGTPEAVSGRTGTETELFRAELDRVRAAGYALVEAELEQGLRSIAVPVRDLAGRTVAAVNVAMHSSRRTAEACVGDVLPELRATATRVEADLHIAGRFRRVPQS